MQRIVFQKHSFFYHFLVVHGRGTKGVGEWDKAGGVPARPWGCSSWRAGVIATCYNPCAFRNVVECKQLSTLQDSFYHISNLACIDAHLQ